jgi:hypothetical protein
VEPMRNRCVAADAHHRPFTQNGAREATSVHTQERPQLYSIHGLTADSLDTPRVGGGGSVWESNPPFD